MQLSRLFRRARSQSARIAGEVHPDLDASGYALLRVLYSLDPSGAGVRAVDLGAALALHKSTTSRAVADLEQLGLLARVPDPHDARARLITLTGEGRSALERSQQGRRNAMAAALAPWTVTELRELAALLSRFNDLDGEA
ncbi:MAG TPA: MarR family transcriptional regulator [Segeticoccus sp.]|uniref:MarR family winged helix-turn-helix transcriptional regulator n=1 Tax=Segeticoccus sp. TaxID=2706531 RepID=UPI002D7E51BD|nr:MarR family transcriptional regulator [Segeticoccus sp.]HET8601820.1 MarR family transcriptional regulator [Segeticoccus sp.]